MTLSGALATMTLACTTSERPRSIDAAFDFANVSYELPEPVGPLTSLEIDSVNEAALSEIRNAFSGMAVRFSQRRNARYTVTVVQHLYDLRHRRRQAVFGSARAIRGLGGRGEVSFDAVASSAVAYAPAGASRRDMIDAFGRGVARVAIHEFIHLLLPNAPIDDNEDPLSYEYGHAARREQYYGELHWGFTRTTLLREFGAR